MPEDKDIMIKGVIATRKVTIGGKRLRPRRSQKIYNHSPDGFSWGYVGSGPAQFALALLLELTNERFARYCYQRFKREVIALLPVSDFELPLSQVEEWITAQPPPTT